MSARKFRVSVNGRSYEVEVEEIENEIKTEIKKTTSVVQKPVIAAKLRKASVSSNGKISAPIPGKVLSLNAKQGDAVKKGDTLLIIESMKIENPIFAPHDGTIAELRVSVGSQVKTGDVMVILA